MRATMGARSRPGDAMTISSISYNNAMAGYVATSNSTSTAGSSSTAAGLSAAAIKSASAQALDKAAHSFKSATAQKQLEAKQVALTTDMRAAAAKAGLQLNGAVGFSLDSSGNLQLSGSDADKAVMTKLFQADKSQPEFVCASQQGLERRGRAVDDIATVSGHLAGVALCDGRRQRHVDVRHLAAAAGGDAGHLLALCERRRLGVPRLADHCRLTSNFFPTAA